MKKFLRILEDIVFYLLALLSAYLVAALVLSYLPAGTASAAGCPEEQGFFVSTNGVHLFMAVPATAFDDEFLQKLNYPGDTRYLYLGWGEKTFYLNTPTWDDLTLPVAAKAMLVPSEAAMHVMYFNSEHASWQELQLCRQQARRITAFIMESFKEADGKFTPLQPKGYGPNNYFYEAHGSYSCLYTSNSWVNQALKKAGVQTAVWTPFDFGVMWHLQNSN